MTAFAPTHHPNAPLLSAAASGALSPAISRILAAHAALCACCRTLMRRIELVGGAALEAEDGADLSPGALEQVLAAIEKKSPEARLPDALSMLPNEIHDIIAEAIGKSPWRHAARGLKILDLDLPSTATGETFRLFRIEPGAGPPRHTHGGKEFTLVLTGAFKDETGTYRPGDIEFGDESMTHRPIAEPGEVCYALAVTTAPLKFKGPLGLLQRVFNFGRL